MKREKRGKEERGQVGTWRHLWRKDHRERNDMMYRGQSDEPVWQVGYIRLCSLTNSVSSKREIKLSTASHCFSNQIVILFFTRMFYQVKEGGYSRLTKYGNYLVWPVEMMMMIKMTCQNNWMASRARGTTERRKPEKISIESFSRLSQENVSKLNFMNHGILCFPS